jgi:hypothetical protein
MTQKVGGIEFDVDVDASGVATGRKAITTDLSGIEGSFNKVDTSAKRLNQTSGKTGKALGGLGKNAGQAGVQLQQFFGQIQGGQSGLLALSQQGADLGIVLGRAGLGAAVGIAATALSFMIPTIRDTKTSLEKLEEIAEAVGKTFETAADGSDIFSESIQRLADRSEGLARVQIAQTIADLEGQIAESASGIKEAADDIGGIKIGSGILDTITELGIQLEDVPSLFGDVSSEVDKLGAGGVLAVRGVTERVDQLATQFGITREQALNLQIALDDFGGNQTALGIATLANQVDQLGKQVDPSNKKFAKFTSSLLPFFDATRTGVNRINLLREALADLEGTLGKNSKAGKEAIKTTNEQNQAAQRQIESLNAQVIALQHGAEAAEIYAATQRAVRDGTTEQLPQVVALIQKKYDLKAAQEASTQAARDEAAAFKEQEASYREFLQALEEGEAINEAKKQRIDGNIETIRQSLMTETELRSQAFQTELEQMQEALENKRLTQAQHDEMVKAKAKQFSDDMVSIEQTRADKEKAIEQAKNREKMNAVAGVFGNLSSLMNTESKKLFKIGKIAALAETIVTGAANAQKAYAGGLRISGGNPAVGAAFAATSLAATAVQLQQIKSAQFGSAGGGQSFQGGQVVNNTSQQQPEQRNVSIALTGSSFTGGDIRTLIGQINEELGDGVTLNTTGG